MSLHLFYHELHASEYEPEKLIYHIEYLLTRLINNLHKKLKFGMMWHYTSPDGYIVYRFNFTYKKQVDIPSKVKEICNKSQGLINTLKSFFDGKNYQGINCKYRVEYKQLVNRDDGLFLLVNYIRLTHITNFDSLPVELINVIITNSDYPSVLHLFQSNILNEYLFSEKNYQVLIGLRHPEIFTDLIYIKKIFDYQYTWKDIYFQVLQIDIDGLYSNINENGEIITKDNWCGNDFKKCKNLNKKGSFCIDKKTPSEIRTLVNSLRIKVIFPELYVKLLTFCREHTSDTGNYINMIHKVILIFIYNDKKLIKALDNYKYDNPRRFPSLNLDVNNLYDNSHIKCCHITRLNNLISSGILLWYYLNIENVIFVVEFYDLEIVSILARSIDINLWMKKLSDTVLTTLINNMSKVINGKTIGYDIQTLVEVSQKFIEELRKRNKE